MSRLLVINVNNLETFITSNKKSSMIFLDYTKLVYKNRGLKKARIFFLRSFLCYPKMVAWLNFIDQFYKKHGFETAPWDLAGLPIRAYVSNHFSYAQKCSLLKEHHQTMDKIFAADVMKKLLSKENGITIATLTKKDGSECYVKIAIIQRFWREGGLTLYLENTDEKMIATATFNFDRDKNGKTSLIISGLQGGSTAEKSDVVTFTRNLGGLRPKYALVDCCYAIADYLNIDQIIGVSDVNHVFASQEGKIKGSYDELWKDIGGVLAKDKNYLLPKALAKRDFESVPQKKRKDWLIRHGHITKLHEDIKTFLKN